MRMMELAKLQGDTGQLIILPDLQDSQRKTKCRWLGVWKNVCLSPPKILQRFLPEKSSGHTTDVSFFSRLT